MDPGSAPVLKEHSMKHPATAICLALFLSVRAVSIPAAPTGPASSADLRNSVDRIVGEVLAASGVSSASVAIVRQGEPAWARAYGIARREPRAAASSGMRYAIGSISKQFTAAAVLLLVEDHKLSLDDPVSRFLPSLTRSGEVTVRQLLSHTSGYQDYWPQDFVPPFMLEPTSAQGILDRWAKKPLDFEPGSAWQYSNTNYVIAGLIIEQAGGMPLFQFLKTRLFAPLGMASVASIDSDRLGDTDSVGYLRYALGPPRVAPKEGRGWLFAAGELAMSAPDLARWDTAVLERRILAPESWRAMQTEVVLANGLGTRYGLGVNVVSSDGHRILSHGGEVSGFTAHNAVFPDDGVAICVLVNQDAVGASSTIADRVAPLLFGGRADVPGAEHRAAGILRELQHGRIDRALFTENGNSYFTAEALRDFASSLGPLGPPSKLRQTERRERGGMTFRRYEVTFPRRAVRILERSLPDGRIEQYLVAAKEE
ncbi:MAG: serine hydrolase domain-containing protein [Acidobacteriota bacterium]